MSIPPFGLALRRRIPPEPGCLSARLMAEYAWNRRCVRAAARGFSPAPPLRMLLRKRRQTLKCAETLESAARLFQPAQAPDAGEIAG